MTMIYHMPESKNDGWYLVHLCLTISPQAVKTEGILLEDQAPTMGSSPSIGDAIILVEPGPCPTKATSIRHQ